MKPDCCKNKSAGKIRQVVEFLKTISEENRLKILCLLEEDEKCVCEIWQYLKLPQNLVSHHLKVLKDFDLISSRKERVKIFYKIKEAVLWKQAIILGVVGALADFGGAALASHLPGSILTKIFGLAILLGSLRMITAKPVRVEGEINKNTLTYVFWGLILGFVTGLIGIGGGVLIVPIMLIFLNFNMHEAVGTSTAMMIFTALGGSLAYIVLGWHHPGLPAHSLGYVNLLQWVLLAGTSVPMAQVGAHLAHKIPAGSLKWLFITVMIYMGLKMIGVFAWLNLPL